MSSDLSGRTAVVTGAGGGIGGAIARELAVRGARTVLVDRSRTGLDALLAEIEAGRGSAVATAVDVTDSAQVDGLFADGDGADVDILVNAAGVLFGTAVGDISEREWDLVVDVNLKGTFLMAQAGAARMRSKGWGRVVNLSSTAGKNVSTIGGAHYTAAKAGVLGLTRHLAAEFAVDGITVNAVCPGLIDTEMVRSTIDDATAERYARGFPVARLGEPGEVAALWPSCARRTRGTSLGRASISTAAT